MSKTSTIAHDPPTCGMLRTAVILCAFLSVEWTLAGAQPLRMVIEGSIQLDGGPVPNGTVVRVLRSDGQVVRTISHYPSNPSQFGVRLGGLESLRDGEPLGFRVVLSRRDSFEARIAGPALTYQGRPPQEAGVTRIVLYRNHTPAFRRTLPDTSIRERQSLRFRVWATDEDADTLRYRLLQAPPGTTIEPLTGYVTYVPGFEDSGRHAIDVAVTDGREEVVDHAVLHVIHVNRPPRVDKAVMDRTVREGDHVTLAIAAEDPDRDPLSYSLIERSYRFRLFSRNGVFEWAPDFESAGLYHCFVVVSDGSVSDTSNTFTIDVEPTNRSPVFSRQLVDTVLTEQQHLGMLLNAVDLDGDSVRYSIELAPEGVSISTTGFLSWMPGFDQAGSYVIVVSAADFERSSESVVRATVLNRNRTPSFSSAVRHDTDRVAFGRLIELNWPGAQDPDTEDTLRYTLRLWGGGVDTSLAGISDTSVTLFGRNQLTVDHVYMWTASVNDGLAEAMSPDTFAFRLVQFPIASQPQREPAAVQPRMFMLEQLGSNPSGSVTLIRYALTHRSSVDIALYTMLGERLQTIVAGERPPGQYETTYDASSLSGGVYMFKLEAHPLDDAQARDFISTKKMVLVK